MRLKLVSVLVALALALLLGVPVYAATSATVTITATPAYIAITNDIATWTLNGITGDSTIVEDTIYYSNPGGDTVAPSVTVVDGECRFEVTNTAGSSVSVDFTVDIGDFGGGSDNSTNSDNGSNGATTFGAYSWYSGMTYASKVVAKVTGSDPMYTVGLAPAGTLKWGAEIETQTNAWTGGSSSTATMTITATKN